MLIIVVAVMVLLYGLERIRRSIKDAKAEECRYRLFDLRDKLREMAISGEIKSSSWLFAYLDSSIAKTIRLLPELSLWKVLAIYVVYKNDPHVSAARDHLLKSLLQPENKAFADIHGEMILTLVVYLYRRHLPVIGVSVMTAVALSAIGRKLRSTTEIATESPAASTLTDFCPA